MQTMYILRERSASACKRSLRMSVLCKFKDLTCRKLLKGGYLDFSHLTELESIYVTEIYLEKKTINNQES